MDATFGDVFGAKHKTSRRRKHRQFAIVLKKHYGGNLHFSNKDNNIYLGECLAAAANILSLSDSLYLL